jgi:GDSL-like lipase/acylhydrolase family protein
MGHVFLLGDSIFDNAAYVGSQPPVVEHLRRALPPGWQATLLAVDGHCARDVREQLRGLEPSATHLFVSAGGNDALNATGVLGGRVLTVAQAVGLLAIVQARFRRDYEELLGLLLAAGKPVTVCTIYDAIPGLGEAERAALSLFNDVILRSAVEALVPVIDLRIVCDRAEDYSAISPIEPSGQGGAKIAKVIADVIAQHDFSLRLIGTNVFTGSARSTKC